MLWSSRAEGVTAIEVAAGIGRRRGRHRARRRAARRQRRRRCRRPPTSSSTSIAAHAGTRLAYTLLRLGHAPAARRLAGADAAAAARCISCSRRSASSRCWSAPRCGCGVRAIRRRCISSGCASRSSARSPSRSTARSIVSTGCSTGATRSRSPLLPPLLLHFTLVFPERPAQRRRRRRDAATLVVPLMYLPALALGAAPHHRRDARRGVGRPAVLARASSCSIARELVYLFVCGVVALVVLVRAFREITSLTGAPPAALDCVGHGARRRAVRVRLRAAVGARRRSAARAAVDGDSARPRAADLRVRRSSATGCATSR